VSTWIGIAIGDVTGIGPEVTLKSLALEPPSDDLKYVLIGDSAVLHALSRRLGLNLSLEPYRGREGSGRVFIHNPLPEPLPSDLVEESPAASRAAVAWLRDGAERCLKQELDALVTAPVSKAAIIRSGQAFIGQTEFLADLSGDAQVAMMLLGEDDRGRWLRVALATTHVSIRNLAGQITRAKVERAIELAAQACRDLHLPRQRVAVCGLNPHAGEGGEFGTEEIEIIGPAVLNLQRRQFDVIGPLSADTLFHRAYRGDYDAVVAMYHDQGLAPLKMVAFEKGVNWTLGLPFIRTSPDHGTAYDIAGQGVADPSSMAAAIRLARQLALARSQGQS
jgi:4-hydroxythreonine-4-phosphate dehydrogenase